VIVNMNETCKALCHCGLSRLGQQENDLDVGAK